MSIQYALITAACLLVGLPGSAQIHNALDFDGVNDKVSLPGASALITGGTGISLSCWVYPTNAAPAFPDFDGFAGMRDEFTADFYLLQVAPANTLEARFRNSVGQAFTLEYSGLQLNTWQFLAFTYDGSQLTLYANGVNVATAPANGSITNSAVDLLVGDVDFQGTDFSLAGRVDEVSLWNRGLSQSEVSCMYSNGVDVNASGLQLYYKMDQGIGGGNNAGINSLIASKGNINGTLSGFALNGASSNFVVSPDVGNNISATICPGEFYVFNGMELMQAGVYGAAYDVGDVCDSLVTLNLSMNTVNTQTSELSGVITSLAADATWQWLDCNNGYAEIPGATGQQFTPDASGSYAVEVTQLGCADTSACVNVIVSGLADRPLTLEVRIFPDPATDHVRIDMGRMVQDLSIGITDVHGRVVERLEIGTAATVDLPINHLDAGLYFIHLRSAAGVGIYRLVKE